MRFVLDTNVLVSGLFFGGKPGRILDWWLATDNTLLVTEAVLAEYDAVLTRLAKRYPSVPAKRLFQQVALRSQLVEGADVPLGACPDASDLKFLACALGGDGKWIISGDKHLLGVDGWRGLRVVSPAAFVTAVIAVG
jgi:putative PIN family toxin of toxin-antitoxin system